MIKHFTKLTQLASKILTSQAVYYIHHSGQDTPKQFGRHWQPWQRKILYNKNTRIIPQQEMKFYDELMLPGYDQSTIGGLVLQFKARKVPLSPTVLCMLIHSFTKYGVMGVQMFDQLQKQAYRLKGQYKIRSIFGALRASIQHNRTNLMNFFLDQYKASHKKFSMQQMVDLLETINQSKFLTQEQKKQLWNNNFNDDFVDGILNIKIKKVDDITRVFDNLVKIENNQQQVILRMISFMRHQKGWDQIPVFERLYQLSGEYEEAKTLFDSYFEKMSQDQAILSRYNLTQLRYLSPLETIKFLEQNPSDFYPKQRTLVPQGEDAQQWNKKYEQFLKVGAVKQEEQIIKDKSKSLGFAIRERYESLKADNIDFTNMKQEQFQQMFGNYHQALETIKQQDSKMVQRQKKRLEQQARMKQLQQMQDQQKTKKSKGKGKKDGNQAKQQKSKQKKEKAKKQQ